MKDEWVTGRLSGKGSRLWKKIWGMPAKKRTDLGLAFGLTAVLFLWAVVQFDFYYDLNDDVLIKDILSGVYSGSPDGHTMQLLYPLGLVLSLCYRVLAIPVFGVFLVGCQFGSIFIIAYRTLKQCRDRATGLLLLAVQGVFWFTAFGRHLVFVQYTITAGMLAGAAILWVLTIPEAASAAKDAAGHGNQEAAKDTAVQGSREETRRFLGEMLPALLLYWTAFCLRSEMALLLLPLAGVAGLCRWAREVSFFARENLCKYLTAFGILLLGLALCLGLDSLAYRENGWPAFRQFFDARTELYDYQKDFVDRYEENAEAYEALGITRQEHALLANYNFGAEDGIDEELLSDLKEAAVSRPGAGGFFRKSLREGLWSLTYQYWGGAADLPYNAVLLFCGLWALALGLRKGHRRLLWQVPLCFAAGGALWLFLLLRDRPVDRVLHPLYLGQIAVFLGLLLLEMGHAVSAEPKIGQEQDSLVQGALEQGGRARFKGRAGQRAGVFVLSSALLCLCLPGAAERNEEIRAEYADREEKNRTCEAVMDYCSAHPGRLFLEDVYSTVSYSEKISVDRDKPFNYDLLGGWLVKSPLTARKLSAFGFSTMGEAVRSGGKVCLLTEDENGFLWLNDYFEQEGIAAQAVRTGAVTQGVWAYQVIWPEEGEKIYQEDGYDSEQRRE